MSICIAVDYRSLLNTYRNVLNIHFITNASYIIHKQQDCLSIKNRLPAIMIYLYIQVFAAVTLTLMIRTGN